MSVTRAVAAGSSALPAAAPRAPLSPMHRSCPPKTHSPAKRDWRGSLLHPSGAAGGGALPSRICQRIELSRELLAPSRRSQRVAPRNDCWSEDEQASLHQLTIMRRDKTHIEIEMVLGLRVERLYLVNNCSSRRGRHPTFDSLGIIARGFTLKFPTVRRSPMSVRIFANRG